MTTTEKCCDLQPGARVWRYVWVGSDGSFDLTDMQRLTVVRVNRVSVTVRTDHGSEFRIEPHLIEGDWNEEWN